MPDIAQAPGQPDSGTLRRFLTFSVGGRLYALRAEDVAELIHVPVVARVPQSPAALLGIANLRGSVLPLVSLRGLLGRPEQASGSSARAIVLDMGAPVALVVDAVDALVTVEAGRIEVREAELAADTGEVLSGAFDAGAGRGAARILDIKRLLEAAFAQRARPERQARASAGTARQQVARETAEQSEMLVTFEVAGQEFALSLDVVQEILPAPAAVTGVPRSEALILGVTALREKLLPLLSLRGLLGFAPAPGAHAGEKVVVMKVGGAQVGLVADRARAVLAADVSRIDPIPAVLSARSGGESRIKSIYRGEGGRRLVSILAPEQLFREDVMQRLGQAGMGQGRQDRQMSQAEAGRAGELQFLVFRLGDDEFGLPIETVVEVAQVPEKITRVPKTPKFLEGVINLRGDVLPVVDQRRRFDMPAHERPEARRLVVVKTDRQRAGIIVDSVSDVLRVATDSVEPAPDLTEQIARLVRGVINLEQTGRIVLVLDPLELLTPAERGLLDAFQKSGEGHA